MRKAVVDLAPIFGKPTAPAVSGTQDQGRCRGRGRGRRGRWGKKEPRKRRWVVRSGLQVVAATAESGSDALLWGAVEGTGAAEEIGEQDMDEEAEVEGGDLASEEAEGSTETPQEADEDVDTNPEEQSRCCLTGALLIDPVLTKDGGRYERAALEAWVDSTGPTDPASGAPLELESCTPDPTAGQSALRAQTAALVAEGEATRAPAAPSVSTAAPAVEPGRSLLGDLPAVPRLRREKHQTLAEAQQPKAKARRAVPNAPAHMRCAIDGKLMKDPVRSPHGHAFERSTLERWVSSCGSVCPVTSRQLRLQECGTDVELQQEIRQWLKDMRKNKSPQGQT